MFKTDALQHLGLADFSSVKDMFNFNIYNITLVKLLDEVKDSDLKKRIMNVLETIHVSIARGAYVVT